MYEAQGQRNTWVGWPESLEVATTRTRISENNKGQFHSNILL